MTFSHECCATSKAVQVLHCRKCIDFSLAFPESDEQPGGACKTVEL